MRSFPLVTLLLLVSCKFDGRVPQGALVGCEANSDCPNDTFCVGFGRCAQRDLYFAAVEGRVSPSKIGPNQMVKIKLSPLNALTDSPVVFGVTNQGRFAATLLSSKPEGFEYEWSVSPTDSSNDVLFLANIASLGVSNVEIGSVQIDREGPVLELRNSTLTPPPDIATLLGSNVRDVKMLSNNMNVEFEVVANETLAGAPEVRLGDTPLVVQDRNGLSYRYKGQLGKLDGIAELPLTAKATDTQNNESTTQLSMLQVDIVPPKAPDVETSQNVVFVREPNGTLDTPGVARFTIRAKASVFEPNSLVVVSSGGGIYSIQKAEGDGSLPETKLPIEVDIQSLALRSVDLAGNVSPSVKVRDVEVAILQTSKQIAFARAEDFNSFNTYFEAASGQPAADGGVALIRTSALAHTKDFAEPFFSDAPTIPTSGVGLIQSPSEPCSQTVRTRTIQWVGYFATSGFTLCGERRTLATQFFGRIITTPLDPVGATATDYLPFEAIVVGAFGVVREFGDSTGRAVQTLDASVGRRFHAAGYDFARAEVVIFGGEDQGGKLLNDTIVYRADGKLEKLPALPTGPSPRKNAAIGYNPLLGRLVLHGGNDGTKTLDDTWSFDGTAWSREKETNPPIAREKHSLGYFTQHGFFLAGGATNGVVANGPLVWDSGWTKPFSLRQTYTYPLDCMQKESFKIVPGANGNAFICKLDGDTRFTYFDPDGRKRTIDKPPYFLERMQNVVLSDRFAFVDAYGLVNYSAEATSTPMYQLLAGQWVATPLTGSCSVDDALLACASNSKVQFSGTSSVSFPAGTPDAALILIWPESRGVWIVHRETAAGQVSRYRVSEAGGIQPMTDRKFRSANLVNFAGAPTGQPVVLLRENTNQGRGYSESLVDNKWIESDYYFGQQGIWLLPAKSPKADVDAFIGGDFFLGQDQFLNRLHMWSRIVTNGIRPTIRVSLPVATECGLTSDVTVEAKAEGEAGGVNGVGIYPFNSRDYQPSPNFAVETSRDRPKTVIPNPDGYIRFGAFAVPALANFDYQRQGWTAHISTVGKTKAATDGFVKLSALQARYKCRLKE